MSLSLLAPLGLAALVALVLPILIHLVRRIELTTTEFAALRWISERVQPQRRIRFERPWLLLLRLLLLARPVLDAIAPPAQPRVFVAPGVDRSAARAAITAPAADWRWLAPGFPRFDDSVVTDAVPLSSLLREADADLPNGASASVIVPQQLGGLDGERMQLAHAFDWHVVAGSMPVAAPPVRAPVTVALRYAADAKDSLVYVRAAVDAWNAREPHRYRLDAQALDAALPADAHWLVWLGPSPPTEVLAWIERGGVALLTNASNSDGEPLWRDAGGNVLARDRVLGRGRAIELPGALSPSTLPLLLDAEFPQRLRAALGDAERAPDRADAVAMKPQAASATASTNLRGADGVRPIDPWLALLIAVVFLAERIVATRARSEAVA